MSKASRLQNEATIASAAIAAESRDFDRISIRLVIYGPGYMRLTQPGPVAPLIKRKPSDREWRGPMSIPIPTAPPLRISWWSPAKHRPSICARQFAYASQCWCAHGGNQVDAHIVIDGGAFSSDTARKRQLPVGHRARQVRNSTRRE